MPSRKLVGLALAVEAALAAVHVSLVYDGSLASQLAHAVTFPGVLPLEAAAGWTAVAGVASGVPGVLLLAPAVVAAAALYYLEAVAFAVVGERLAASRR